MHILQPEGSGVWIVSEGIFPRAEEEEEPQGDHLPNCLKFGVRCDVGLPDYMLYDLQWDGLDSGRRWVVL
jgi:hypothetical protein